MDMNDQGMLSIDFLAGFTIFLLGLLLVISMVPGVLVGIRSASIDYDAVAYRTAAILVEDPGWPSNPAWDQKDSEHADEIVRLGLAISKDYPNILSRNKVEKFFDRPEYFELDQSDFEEKILFADIPYLPYAYNFSLKIEDEPAFYVPSGTDVPDSRYGYMRRLVMVKNDSYAKIDVADDDFHRTMTASPGNFTNTTSMIIRLDYNLLRNRAIPEPYRIDPSREPIRIIIHNLTGFENATDVVNVTFDGILFRKEGATDPIPYNYSAWDNETYQLYADVDGADDQQLVLDPPSDYFIYKDLPSFNNTTQMQLDLLPPLPFSTQSDYTFLVDFSFTYNFVNGTTSDGVHHYIGGTQNYNYTADYIQETVLKPGVLEVFIW